MYRETAKEGKGKGRGGKGFESIGSGIGCIVKIKIKDEVFETKVLRLIANNSNLFRLINSSGAFRFRERDSNYGSLVSGCD